MPTISQLQQDPELARRLEAAFGSALDPMPDVESRAQELLPDYDVIVWEGDAATFHFGYVGRASEKLLGYPAERWTTEPTFWAETVVHPEDRDDAVAYCALCTGKGEDHDFEYRAVAADGRLVVLHDVVKVIKGELGVATRLRGIMLDVTARRADAAQSPA